MGESEAPENSGARVRAVTRATEILRSFTRQPLQSLAEIARAANLDKGTSRRILLTLMDTGFVVQNPDTQKYGLGHVVRGLAASVVDDFDLISVAVPILTRISTELHLTSFLAVYREHSAVCLRRMHDLKFLTVQWWPEGGTMPTNIGGAPKLLLAFQSNQEIESALAKPLKAFTPSAITDQATLGEHLEQIRARGWEFAVDDAAVGLAALAVPVFDDDGSLICSLSISGLTPQMVNEGKPAHLSQMLAAAKEVERGLGGGHHKRTFSAAMA